MEVGNTREGLDKFEHPLAGNTPLLAWSIACMEYCLHVCHKEGKREAEAAVQTSWTLVSECPSDSADQHRCASCAMQGACESVVPLLVEKLGDANARLREASKELLVGGGGA